MEWLNFFKCLNIKNNNKITLDCKEKYFKKMEHKHIKLKSLKSITSYFSESNHIHYEHLMSLFSLKCKTNFNKFIECMTNETIKIIPHFIDISDIKKLFAFIISGCDNYSSLSGTQKSMMKRLANLPSATHQISMRSSDR